MKHTVELIDTSTFELSSFEIKADPDEDLMVVCEELREQQEEITGSDYLVHNVTRGGLDG